ncbi:MAG: outer membrane beta-barrel protein [Bacteroidetes bacterium]|nr:outer membrane beta-barrel protein [Bacteroidota bacterium]
MRTFIIILFVQILTFELCFGQESIDTSRTHNPMFGFYLGYLTSRNIDDSKNNPNHSYDSKNMTLDCTLRPGFNLGFFISIINWKHFSLEPELNYSLSSQKIKYHSHSASPSGSNNNTYADYSMSTSFLQVSILPKFKFGKRIRYYIGIGPFFNSPKSYSVKGQIESEGHGVSTIFINDSIGTVFINPYYHEILKDNAIKVDLKSTQGFLISTGFYLPKKNNLFGLDLRLYYSKENQVEFIKSSYMFLTLNLTYQLKPKRNVM